MGLSATKKLHAYRHTILASLIETTAQQLNHAMLPWEAACFKGLAKLQAATVDPTATKLRGGDLRPRPRKRHTTENSFLTTSLSQLHPSVTCSTQGSACMLPSCWNRRNSLRQGTFAAQDASLRKHSVTRESERRGDECVSILAYSLRR